MFRRSFLSLFGLGAVGCGMSGEGARLPAGPRPTLLPKGGTGVSPARLEEFAGELKTCEPPVVRVWKVGEPGWAPSQATAERLAGMLRDRRPGESLDIVWSGEPLEVVQLDGGGVDVVSGPGIRVTRDGNVVKVEAEV